MIGGRSRVEGSVLVRAALVLGTLVLAASARADVVMPPPTECPRGAMGAASHLGPHCMPTTCTAASSCETFRGYAYQDASFECLEAGLCVRTQSGFGGRGGRREYTVALSSCGVSTDCPAESRCEIVPRCVVTGTRPRDQTPVAPRAAASGCSAAATSAVFLLAFLGAGTTFTWRRARERDRASAVRTVLASRGHATRSELEALVGREGSAADRSIAQALAPIATRVRIEESEGELVYALEDDEEREQRS